MQQPYDMKGDITRKQSEYLSGFKRTIRYYQQFRIMGEQFELFYREIPGEIIAVIEKTS